MNIIELARRAGGKVWPYAKSVDFSYDELERFAALVRAEERERIAKFVDVMRDQETMSKHVNERDCFYARGHLTRCAAAIRGMK